MSLPSKKGKIQGVKRQLILDLQTFLWRFEQGGYSRDSMHEVLEFLEKALESEAHEIGGAIEEHISKMITDCHAYAEGKGNPKDVVRDLDQLRQDLEK